MRRQQRSIRLRGRRKAREVVDVEINSLLDILVILLVFLIKSSNSSGVIINVPKDLSLPMSQSQSVNTSGVNVVVAQKFLWVDEKVIIECSHRFKNAMKALKESMSQ